MITLYHGCRKTQPPLNRFDFRLKTANFKRGLKAAGRLVLLRCSWSIHALYFMPLLLSSNLLYFLTHPPSQGPTSLRKLKHSGEFRFPSPLPSNVFVPVWVTLVRYIDWRLADFGLGAKSSSLPVSVQPAVDFWNGRRRGNQKKNICCNM